MKTVRRLSTYLLDLFNSWFVSDRGVWQTLGICLVVVVIEQTFPFLDPNGFVLLYALTVYSGITQPALARAGRVSAEQQAKLLERIESLEEQNAAMLKHLEAIRGEK